LDIATLMTRLSPDLRELCDRLQHDTPRAVAKALGLSRRDFDKKVAALRHHLQEMEIEKSCEKSGQIG
jgi:hypothetical protein